MSIPVVAARAGFTPQEIELDASAILQGEPAATPVVVNDRAYTIRVRFPENSRASLDQIRNTLITSSSTGKTATLGSLANFQDEAGQTEIIRENLQRRVAVTGRFEGVSLGRGHQSGAAGRGGPAPSAFDSRRVRRHLRRNSRSRSAICWWCWRWRSCWCFTVLLFEFRTFAAPAAILASALLSTSGVFFALLVTGTTFNISSFMGLIMVIGIVAKNGILLLDADQRFRAEGSSVREAMILAGERRLRPILMTALATDRRHDSLCRWPSAPARRCCSRWRLPSSAVWWLPWSCR